MNVDRFLKAVRSSSDYREQVVGSRRLPAHEARYGEPAPPLEEGLAEALREQGIAQLYLHQAQALERARAGCDLVIVTGTASGKTLCYHVPILEHLLQSDPNQPARALYLYPTKALAQDQLRGLQRLLETLHQKSGDKATTFKAGTYDGDTPPSTRTTLRNHAHLLLSNPDMLHSGVLPQHPRWAHFFASLRYVVLDEIHTYRGVFGSNVANVLRRLQRIAEHYGARPQFICSSATIANPMELAEKLTGRPMTLIDDDGSPRGPRQFLLWNPPLTSDEWQVTSDERQGTNREPQASAGSTLTARHSTLDTRHSTLVTRRSPVGEAARLLAALMRARVPTIAFVRSRGSAELIYRYAQEELTRTSPGLANSLRAYRAGYLPEERRQIERALFSGELLGVTATSALELGIDVGALEACLIVGYPGSISSTWQRAGRAGRREEEALIILLAQSNPIDQYLMRHPGYFFEQSPEHAIIDPENVHLLLKHLRCAAVEAPLTIEEISGWGEFAPAVVQILEEERQLTRRGNAYYWSSPGYPARDVNLRTIGENTYTIVDTTLTREGAGKNRVIGSLDETSAFQELHREAVYLHDGETHLVERLDLQERVAYLHKAEVDYFTQAVSETTLRVLGTEQEKVWRVSRLGLGDVAVTELVILFKKIKFHSLDSIGYGNLDLPPLELETSGMWLVPPPEALARVREFGRVPSEGMLGIANLGVQVVPLFTMCDLVDLGSVLDSSQMGVITWFLYDKYPGGLGFAQKAYDLIEEILEASLRLIAECPCDEGCPSCVGSIRRPFSYRDAEGELRERIPDKEAARVILHALLEREPYVPRPLPDWRRLAEEPSQELEIKPLPDNVAQKLRIQVRKLVSR